VAKKKMPSAKFNSHSTPGHQMDLSAWLVEIAMTRQNQGIKLPPRFWTDTRWKFRFGREIQAVRKFIKEYGEKSLLQIVMKNYVLTYTNYAEMQVFLQKTKESKARLAYPKDNSEVKSIEPNIGPDLREEKTVLLKKKGLFERLRDMNDNATLSN
jgi:hypothetical protein